MKNKILLKSLFILGIFTSSIAQNIWIQKQNLTGMARNGAVAFSIGTKGYVGTGDDGSTSAASKDFWEWDQATNTWSQKANAGSGIRHGAVGFSIGTKGYIGVGDSAGVNKKD